MDGCILRMCGINKSFFGVPVLKNAQLEVLPGEVHVLLGEKGAGKSTLIKILSGAYGREGGDIQLDGRELAPMTPKEALDAGISVIYQEFNLVPDLPVYENIFIGKEYGQGLLVDHKRAIKEAEGYMKRVGLEVSPRTLVRELSVAQKQLVEIAKAISNHVKILVLDEPTAAITDKETNMLFGIIRELQKEKIGIVYISHRMDEINQITDRVTVMRDGEYVGTLTTKDSTKDDIIQMMVGRTVYEEPKSFSNVKPSAPVVLKVEHLNVGKTVKDVSFELRKGEILGFSGLMGAGRTETARAIFGADRRDSGDIYVNGKRVDIKNPQDAVDAGIGYLSEDRKRYGVIIEKTVAENTTMASLKAFCKGLFIDKNAEKETAEQYVEALKTKTPSVEQQVRSLSGGNQQKVVIAKWLTRNCDILIFDEPTRGIDVGAKSEIYTLMNNLVKQGKSIIMISSELTEVLRMSDRILIMCEGRKTGEISIEEATQEKIMHAATLRD